MTTLKTKKYKGITYTIDVQSYNDRAYYFQGSTEYGYKTASPHELGGMDKIDLNKNNLQDIVKLVEDEIDNLIKNLPTTLEDFKKILLSTCISCYGYDSDIEIHDEPLRILIANLIKSVESKNFKL